MAPNAGNAFMVTVPIRDGSISYYGDKSGELGHYIGVLCSKVGMADTKINDTKMNQ